MPAYILRGTEVQFPYEAYQCQVHTSPRIFSPTLLNIQHDLGLFAFLFLVAHVRYLIDLQLDYMERVLQALQEVLSGLHHALIKVRLSQNRPNSVHNTQKRAFMQHTRVGCHSLALCCRERMPCWRALQAQERRCACFVPPLLGRSP